MSGSESYSGESLSWSESACTNLSDTAFEQHVDGELAVAGIHVDDAFRASWNPVGHHALTVNEKEAVAAALLHNETMLSNET